MTAERETVEGKLETPKNYSNHPETLEDEPMLTIPQSEIPETDKNYTNLPLSIREIKTLTKNWHRVGLLKRIDNKTKLDLDTVEKILGIEHKKKIISTKTLLSHINTKYIFTKDTRPYRLKSRINNLRKRILKLKDVIKNKEEEPVEKYKKEKERLIKTAQSIKYYTEKLITKLLEENEKELFEEHLVNPGLEITLFTDKIQDLASQMKKITRTIEKKSKKSKETQKMLKEKLEKLENELSNLENILLLKEITGKKIRLKQLILFENLTSNISNSEAEKTT